MTEKPSESITSVDKPEASAPLPGQGTGGCGGLIIGVAGLVLISLVCTVIGYSIVHGFGWV